MKLYKNLLAPILAALCWSLSYIMTNMAFLSFRPITIVFFRVIIASLFMLFIALLSRQMMKIKRAHLKWFLLLGLIEPFSYFLCETYGLTMVSSTLAAVILSTIPLFTPFFSTIFLKEKVTIFNIAGLLISIGGVALIILDGNSDFAYKKEGLFLLFGGVVIAIVYSLFVRRLSQEYSEITIVTCQNIVGIFLFMPLFFFIDFEHLGELPIYTNAILAVVVLGVFASALAFIFYAYSLKHNGIVKTNIFLNLLPALTAVLAYFILGDAITLQMIIGISVVIMGLYISQLRKIKPDKKTENGKKYLSTN